MFAVKRNQVFTSSIAGRQIRVRAITKNPADAGKSLVEIVSINDAGKALKGTERTVYASSIQRRYEY